MPVMNYQPPLAVMIPTNHRIASDMYSPLCTLQGGPK